MSTEQRPTGTGVGPATGDGVHQHGDDPTRALTALLVGAAAFGIVTTVAFVIAGDFFQGSYEDRLARIEDHLTVWRVEWPVALVSEACAGLGLWGLGRWFGWRGPGARGPAAVLVSIAGALAIAAGASRFVVSLRSPEYGADPDTWVDIAAISGVVGLVVAAFALAWLSWHRLAPRWTCVLLVVFAVISVVTLSPSPVYFPGLTVYAGAGLWRATRSRRVP